MPAASTDFLKVKEIVREKVLADIDHNDLNRILDNPTAENVVTWMWRRLEPHIGGLKELQLYETDDAAVTPVGARAFSAVSS